MGSASCKNSITVDLDITQHGGVSCEGGVLLAHNLSFPRIAYCPHLIDGRGSKDPPNPLTNAPAMRPYLTESRALPELCSFTKIYYYSRF